MHPHPHPLGARAMLQRRPACLNLRRALCPPAPESSGPCGQFSGRRGWSLKRPRTDEGGAESDAVVCSAQLEFESVQSALCCVCMMYV